MALARTKYRTAWAVVNRETGNPVGFYVVRDEARQFQGIVAKLRTTHVVRIRVEDTRKKVVIRTVER